MPRPPAAEPPLVLIVDDYEQSLKLAREVLRAAGFRTLEAGTGAEAIALADQHVPDVILMDLRLPDMSGTDAARRLGEGLRTARIPVVALSSLPLDGGTEWLKVAGFVDCLEKPIHVREFPEQVRRHCAGDASIPSNNRPAR
jgi:two-component system, cell cycle response regulator DivK